MSRTTFRTIALLLAAVGTLVATAFTTATAYRDRHRHVVHASTVIPVVVPGYSPEYLATLEAAKVFGRAPACANAGADLIEATAKAALHAGLDPAIAAATVATESGCDQFAVSNRGAVGMMQIMVKVWKPKYDFGGKVNLLNRDDNLRVGTEILAPLIKQYGVVGGLARYQGLGTSSPSFDAGYTDKIVVLAGKH